MRYKHYYDVVRTLRKKCKLKYPINIRRIKMPDFGDCWFDEDKKKFIIHISRSISQSAAIDSILHEWAHAISWSEEKDHGEQWGIAYSKLYRLYEKEFLYCKQCKK